jgi:arabinofuranosyltransferase
MEMHKETGNPIGPTNPAAPKIVRQYPSVSLLILALPILLAFASIAIQNWNVVFDDAFITYRYAHNLAMGHGITWNPGYPPTEGYTNFLLVLILAPVIWAGLDPLLFTRILSFICVIAMGAILFTVARRQYNCSPTVAGMVATLIVLVPATEALCLVGLETVIYAFFLLVTFIAGVAFIDQKLTGQSILFSCLLFLTMLLRPEAALLYPVIFIAFTVAAIRNKSPMKPLTTGFLTLMVLGGIYLTWKHFHFGQLLPNPFYLKASGHTFISPYGLYSVTFFIKEYALLLLLALLSLILALSTGQPEQSWNKLVVLTGSAFAVVYCLFFIHIDTLMDIYGRFLYPLVPIVIMAATPILSRVLSYFESVSYRKTIVLPALMVIFLLAFSPADIFKFYERINRLSTDRSLQANESYMGKELHIAKALARYPQIKEVRIAFADAGVIPYFTGATWLDVVGLNDGFIAKSHNKNDLVDYFFIWSPDLVIHPGKAGLSWLRVGHGPLGDYLSWSKDPRWDEYEYVGTNRMDDIPYDLQYFVKKSSRFRGSLEAFLKANVVDGWYDPFPLPIGTYHPGEIQPKWRSR